jgi:hypothetical protein
MRPQTTLRARGAGLALGALAVAAFATGSATGAHAAPARAAADAHRPGDVAIHRHRLNVVSGRRALVSGRVVAAGAGRPVALQRRAGEGWRTIDRARTAPDGAFAFRFRPREPGSAVVRVRSGTAGEHVGRLNVYRPAQASWYGPGLYGGHLACGGTLTAGTLGVANRSLPCGAKVTLRHRGHTLRVPVVDRGPYVGGREFDLTAATKDRLGFSGVGTILVAS